MPPVRSKKNYFFLPGFGRIWPDLVALLGPALTASRHRRTGILPVSTFTFFPNDPSSPLSLGSQQWTGD